jgi:hypothetical protein
MPVVRYRMLMRFTDQRVAEFPVILAVLRHLQSTQNNLCGRRPGPNHSWAMVEKSRLTGLIVLMQTKPAGPCCQLPACLLVKGYFKVGSEEMTRCRPWRTRRLAIRE